MNMKIRLGQRPRYPRPRLGLAFGLMLVVAVLATAAACSGNDSGKAVATAPTAVQRSSAVVTGAGTSVPCLGGATPTAAAGGAWQQVAAALGNAGIVLQPAQAPLGFAAPRLAGLCSQPGAAEYTVVYGSASESLALCLDSCSGEFGNFPPPTATGSKSLRGVSASEMTAKHADSGQPSAYEISWTENGRRYIAHLTSQKLQMSDLEAVVKSLAPAS